jgi:carboxymethylenebutenolidase
MRTDTAQVGDGVPAHRARPEPGEPPRGGIVVLQDARGITRYLESVCARLASAGWYALAPHLYHRDGLRELDPANGWAGAQAQLETLTAAGIAADVDACLGELAAAGLGGRRGAVLGFCMGGTAALFTAATHELGAAVTFYGGPVGWVGVPSRTDLAAALRTPWLGLFGDEDALIPPADVEAIRAAAARAPAPSDVVRYPNAGHAFHSDDRAAVYRQDAAVDGWRRAMEWLDRHVRPS